MIYTLTLNPAVDRELTVAEIEYDSVLRATQFQVDYGGKGFNVSRMLKSLGGESVALGFAGGRSGELLRDGLHTLGIHTDFVWVSGETRTNISIVTQAHGHYIKVNEPGPTISSGEQQALVEKVRELARPGDWWVLAGSLPPGVSERLYAEMITILHEGGAKAILDTNGKGLEYACRAAPYLVKPNDFEAHQLTGLPVDTVTEIAAAAAAVQRLGATCVVVSLGKEGALCVDAKRAWKATSPVIEEKNPIGAGDSMVGGIVWGLSKRLPLQEALRWGVACGAATASMSGTEVGAEPLVIELLGQVEIGEV